MKMPRYLHLTIIVLVLAGTLWLATNLFLLPREAVHAAPLVTFNVNDTTDLVDDNIGNGICHTASGTCTLRAAIQEANQTSGATISLPAGTYPLTITGAIENNAATGDLDILSSMIISGAGSTTTIIQGAPGWNDRIIQIIAPAQVQISGVTIRNGSTDVGGGIFSNGSLTLADGALISNTVTDSGGGIFNSGVMTISASAYVSNTAANAGGGIGNSGVLTVTTTSFVTNTAKSNGGAIWNNTNATATLSDTQASNNRVTNNGGGAFYNDGFMTINNSQAISNAAPFGGGIENDSQLTLNNSQLISNNATNQGGGIWSAGTLTLTNSTLVSNTAANFGGGLYNYTGNTVTVSGSQFISNTSQIFAGGIYNDGALSLNNTTLISNTAIQVGGLWNNTNGQATLNNSVVVSNTTTGSDAAIDNQGVLTITSSSVIYNHGVNAVLHNAINGRLLLIGSIVANNFVSAGAGSGIYNGGNVTTAMTIMNSTIVGNINQTNDGGGIYNTSSGLTIANSAIISNTAGRYAGGLFNTGGGFITMTNSTVSGNTANDSGGGLYNGATMSLYNVTIANNTADNDNNGVGHGGGIYRVGGAITLTNTLIGTNIDKSGVAPDCFGTLNSLGYNLIGDTKNCTLSGNLSGVITNTNPQLAPLAQNGGATMTHALLGISPAVNAGNPGGCRDWNNILLMTDQRGFKRPFGPRCDLGAFELQFYYLFLPLITHQ